MARTSLSEIEQRNNRTLEYMHNHSSVTVEELAQYLQVSTVTVRRDLNYLLNEKMVLRTSAGHYALNEDPSFDVALFQRYSAHHLEKTAIARAALDLIPSGSVIGLDSSTTVLELGKLLSQKEHLTVVTNNLFIPLPAPKSKAVFGWRLCIFGPKLYRGSRYLPFYLLLSLRYRVYICKRI